MSRHERKNAFTGRDTSVSEHVDLIVCPLRETGPGNLRNSEGAVIELRDGRLLLAYTHFCADADDFGAGDIRGKLSEDGGRTWSEPFLIEPNSARCNVGRLSLARLAPMFDGYRRQAACLAIVYVELNGFYHNRLLFKTSIDEGKTWSCPVQINDTGTLGFVCKRNDAALVLSTGRLVVPVLGLFGGMCASFTYYSDDGGVSWSRSLGELSIRYRDEDGRVVAFNHFEEPAVAELRDGRLLCFGRTNTGRLWQAASEDHGVTWTDPEPTELAASYSPACLKTIPGTGDLLCVWNQADANEIRHGFGRMRMSCAVSQDDGKTWGHFRNLESLDDRARIQPPVDGRFDTQSEEAAINARKALAKKMSPQKAPRAFTSRYPRFPGYCWNDYPSVCLTSNGSVVITYGASDREMAGLPVGLKVVVRPVDWLYEETGQATCDTRKNHA